MVITDRRQSVRRFFPRLLAKFAATILVVLLAGSYFTYYEVSVHMDELEASSIQAMTEGTVAGLSDMIVTRDYTHLQETLRQSMDNHNIDSLAVTDLRGRALSEMTRSSGAPNAVFNDTVFEVPPKDSPRTVTTPQEGKLIIWQKIDSNHHIGWLRIVMNKEHFDHLRSDLVMTLLLTIGVMIIVMGLIVGYQFSIAYGTMNQYEEGLLSAAHTDPLTQLPNRLVLDSVLLKSMQGAIANKTSFAVAFLDLDGFKQVNDRIGHDAGDALLKEVATRLKRMLREDDHVIRLAGDEFILVLNDLPSTEVNKLLNRICNRVSQPYTINNEEVVVGTSIGVTEYQSVLVTPDTLVKQADTAMYHAKRAGKNQVFHYKDVPVNDDQT